MPRIRGLELLFNLVKNQIQSKGDCIVAAIHCLLINENLQCVGIGEEFSASDVSTELLPQHWNDNQEVYTLRYTNRDSKKQMLVKIIRAGPIMHVTIVFDENITAAMSVHVNEQVADDYSDYSTAYVDLGALSADFQRDISDKILSNPNKESTAKSPGTKLPPKSPSAPMPRPVPHFEDPAYPFVGGGSFPQIGGQDLDPLGRGHGGMLLDPFDFGVPSGRNRQPPFGLPRGAVPPGARFDPFGPPLRGPDRFRPNPDHFRKPDDMDDFM